MTFIIIFLEARLILVRLRFIKTFVQIAAFIAAWVTMLSRVSDYWHRFTDVLAGFFLGLIIALFVLLVLGRVLWEYKVEKRIYEVDDLKEK
jgi:phosphatidate phosphatase